MTEIPYSKLYLFTEHGRITLLTAWLCIPRDSGIHDTESNYSLLAADTWLACTALVRRKFIDQSVVTLSAYIFGGAERRQPITEGL